MVKSSFEKSQNGQHAYSLPRTDVEFEEFFPTGRPLRGDTVPLPEISEIDLMRHFCTLAGRNVGIDNLFYPLGSCTMKLNPRVNEWCASLPAFTNTHPLAPDETVQGNLQVIYDLIKFLCRLCGMHSGTLTPCAGAQGEFTGIKMIAAYHASRHDNERCEILIPDDAHGTNPATASMAGFKTIPVRTSPEGYIDLDHLKQLVSSKTAALMLTNPNTLGLFSPKITEVASIVHGSGGLLYYDGANLNAIMNIVRPGDMGFDVMHINLHKTFSTPHGGGGPGSGPVLCNEKLASFLPTPRVHKESDGYHVIWHDDTSIGRISTFHGNFGIYLRAYLYAILHGNYGLRRISEMAVLNANYLKKLLSKYFTVPYPQFCMHEFVVQADNFIMEGIKAIDIAKRFLDYGVHAPTIYFPLIVKECMLVEPTESESKETLDRFAEIVSLIVKEIHDNPDSLHAAPQSKAVRRLDEVQAAKKPILKHTV